ncbi:hypothetical protein R3I93_003436 [Phoxinus phoxinus]|uniref:Uncharacterized protein n=1 Tax=Phoxinus phoxinus TaxID=58324 RepID=A0AAN9DH48_9TELE
MATPSKPKTTIDIEEDWPNATHSDEEDEAPQHQTEDDSNGTPEHDSNGTPEHDSIWTPKRPKINRDYKNDVKELEERVKPRIRR